MTIGSSSTAVAVTNALTVGTTLGVTGAATLSSTLGVTGATTLTGSVTAASGLVMSNTAADYTQIIMARGADNNFQTFVQNGVVGNTSGDDVCKFGLRYNTVNTWAGGIRFIRGVSYADCFIAFDTNATQRMRINSNGTISINNTNTTYQLDVNGTGRFVGAVTLDSTLGVTGATTLSSTLSVANELNMTSSNPMTFADAVYDTTKYSRIAITGSGINQYDFHMAQNAYYDNASVTWKHVNTGGFGGLAVKQSLQGGTYGVYTCNTATDPITWINAIYATSAGNVGIGTITPNAKFAVGGTDSKQLMLWYDTGNDVGRIDAGDVGTANKDIWMQNNGMNVLLAVGGGKVRVGSATAPSSTLDVTGSFNATTNATIGGTLEVTGTSTLTGRITATGGLTTPDSLVTQTSYAGGYNAMYIRNTSADPAAYSIINMGNDVGYKFYIFQNSSTRTSDGPASSTTIRTDSGYLRIGGSGGLLLGCSLDAGTFNISNCGTLTATTLAGTLSTAAQTNVTSVGTLTSLGVAGAHTSQTISPNIDNTYNLGTVSTKRYANVYAVNLYGAVKDAAQTSITSVGTLTGLTVNGSTTTLGINPSGDYLYNLGGVSNHWNILYCNSVYSTVGITTAGASTFDGTVAINNNLTVGTTGTNRTFKTQGTALVSTTATTSANASAALHVDSTTKGFLPPVMTTTQMNAIASPATGLTVYDSTLRCLATYSGAGSWVYYKPLYLQNQGYYHILDINAAASGTGTGLSMISPWGSSATVYKTPDHIYVDPAAINNWMQYDFADMAEGIYKLKYCLWFGANRGVVTVSEVNTSLTIRSIDTYSVGNPFIYIEDTFVWPSYAAMKIRWASGSKHASSSSYYVILANAVELVRVT